MHFSHSFPSFFIGSVSAFIKSYLQKDLLSALQIHVYVNESILGEHEKLKEDFIIQIVNSLQEGGSLLHV